ncbi:MAG: primosomal protein N' [Pyrinomonadaceae bacterium]|nr:primosomal protein N' [Pyrinomonadaceae bacterium]
MPLSTEKTLPEPHFVEAALPLPFRHTFTYALPEQMRGRARIGARIIVPFGKRSLTGYIVGLLPSFEETPLLKLSDIKDVIELADTEPLLTPEIMELAKWTADYYAASWGEVLKASLPAGINAAVEQFFTITEKGRIALAAAAKPGLAKWKLLAAVKAEGELSRRELGKEFGESAARRITRELLRDGLLALSERSLASKVRPKFRKAVRLLGKTIGPDDKPFTAAQQAIVDALEDAGGEMLFTELTEAADAGASPITTLAKRGFVQVYVQEVLRDPLADADRREREAITLNAEQSFVLSEIEKGLEGREYKGYLLHGVTGSGKTEVYMRAMRSAMEMGRSSLMLVPEIALTPIFSRRLRAVFGHDVAILHSNLSPGERFDEWRRIRSGDAKIVIGTRSAVFAPLQNVGLIIVDEEHDSSYRQNESPFYGARDVAVKRAHAADAVIVLGSATPALETFFNAQNGKYQYLQLQNRIGGRPLAKAELIDMRDVFRRAGKDVVFSPQLIEAIEETHAKGEQSIILLNRRGFSSFVLCRSCGETLRCKNCDITLTYHKRDGKLECHYCNYTTQTPDACPFCESEFLYFLGRGTEQLEDILARKFSHLRITRIDRDTMSRKGELTKALLAFDKGEIDMLVGTQILAKGHDFHNVTLVGVVSVDTGLGLPDFRSAERTFQLLTQVAGRAGRGDLPGRVLIQTYYPEHYALKFAAEQDFEGFYNAEIRYRQRLGYPPFMAIASIMLKHRDEAYAMKSARILRDSLDRANPEKQLRILGPAQASIARIKNEFRLQIIIKSESRKSLRTILDTALAEAEARGCDRRIVQVEIDPVNLM